MKELQEMQQQLAQQLAQQNLLPRGRFAISAATAQSGAGGAAFPMVVALVYMMVLDIAPSFPDRQAAASCALAVGDKLRTLGGFLRHQASRTGKGHLDRSRRSGDRQANSLSVAFAAGVSPVARRAQAVQLFVRGAGADSHRGGRHDGVLLRLSDGYAGHCCRRRRGHHSFFLRGYLKSLKEREARARAAAEKGKLFSEGPKAQHPHIDTTYCIGCADLHDGLSGRRRAGHARRAKPSSSTGTSASGTACAPRPVPSAPSPW